eukprot:contig_5974_g1360
MVLGGVSTAVAGVLLLQAAAGGAGRVGPVLPPPSPPFFVAPPHVGVFPLLTLLTGLLMSAHGLTGMAASLRSSLFKSLLGLTVVTYLLAYLNFTIVQVGAIDTPTGGPPQAAALHSGLILLTALIGPYFAGQARQVRAQRAGAD